MSKVKVIKDPETGRFVKVSTETNEIIVDKPRGQKTDKKALKKVAAVEAIIKKLDQPLVVFSDRSLNEDKSSKMRVGSEVEVIETKVVTEQGLKILRVRKPGSTRTFYTTEDRF
jgi:hypothetical protein